MLKKWSHLALVAALLTVGNIGRGADEPTPPKAEILTPTAPATPRINGPSVFGVRPGSPFLYTIPATGERPMEFSVEGLPKGLQVDVTTGQITGLLPEKGEFKVVLKAKNAQGENEKKFRIVAGDYIALTPPMGWNSWNSWAENVDQEKVLASAKILVSSGLINHGWTYVNIDDTWQGKRTGKDKALLSNEKFPDMKGLCDTIHKMGLKAGIYSTPWMTSYANYAGGSADNAEGEWSKERLGGRRGQKVGQFHFTPADANQYAAWEFDYLKYDWFPNDIPATEEMSKALRASGRDIVYSLSNTAPFQNREGLARLANSWRTTGDIWDHWEKRPDFHSGIDQIINANERWESMAGPGHWNDPDMLVVGWVSVGSAMHPSRLTPNEQYAHISMWCMFAAPLLIGCDLAKLDDFTLNLLTNDEVLAIDQDALGKQATRIATEGEVKIYLKPLEDNTLALCFLNCGSGESTVEFKDMAVKGLPGKMRVRDLWRQKDQGEVEGAIKATVPSHGVMLYKLTPIR
ncbi:MAG TPA: putative Ig domain-containing protein [Candidatus Sumerlaeota bacterium]|nr:putative Ig domain-containing protein [Candidatus Sumerlaeota bacterium]